QTPPIPQTPPGASLPSMSATSLIAKHMSALGDQADIALPVKISTNGKMNHGIHISQLDRRHFAAIAAGSFAAFFSTVRPTGAVEANKRPFVAEGARMEQGSVVRGEQPFGAVVVMDGGI